MENLLKDLKLDAWYKLAIVVGVAVLLLALTIELKGVENSVALLIAIGVTLIGTGEWINHPKTTSFRPPSSAYPGYLQIERHTRVNKPLGNFCLALGFIFIVAGGIHGYF